MSLLNRHENEAVGADNPLHSEVKQNKQYPATTIHYVTIAMRRQKAYCRDVLRNTGIEHPTIVQLVMMDYVLKRSKQLFMSINDLVSDSTYDYYRTRTRHLYDVYSLLNKRGLLERRLRPAQRGKASVTVWGFTARGRAMLGKYYAYLSGEYDHLL